MKKEELKLGDMVRLQSGGPKMTVSGNSRGGVTCLWFDKKDLKEGMFPPELLEAYTKV